MSAVPARSWSLGPGEPGLVSVVIPTYHRVREMLRAVDSVLAQTYANFEAIVVADGPDDRARAALVGCDPRVQYLEMPVNGGPAEARNEGVRRSRGEWICFLDDDDLMLPEKLAKTLALADASRPQRMISCRTIYRREGEDDVWPTRPIADGEDIADYILVRPSLLGRPGVVPIQALMVHRSILQAVPLSTHEDHEDWAWLLEAWHMAGARVVFCWEPLVVYSISTESMSRSRRMNWRASVEWAMAYRRWIGRRALNSFLSTKVALKAKRAGDWRGFREVAGMVLRNRPGWLDLAFLAGIALLPSRMLHGLWQQSLRSEELAGQKDAEA